MTIGKVWLCVLGFVATSLPGVVMAHHSYAMFDRSHPITIVGTIEDFQMVNPHSWLDILVMGANGTPQKWSFEGGTYSQMIRRGVRPSTFKRGDKVTCVVFPLRDGRNGGHLVKATTSDGTVIETVPGESADRAPGQ